MQILYQNMMSWPQE